MYINSNLSVLIYQTEHTKDIDKPWIYNEEIRADSQPETTAFHRQPQPKPSLHRTLIVIMLNSLKK